LRIGANKEQRLVIAEQLGGVFEPVFAQSEQQASQRKVWAQIESSSRLIELSEQGVSFGGWHS